jgi:hypothetical protein
MTTIPRTAAAVRLQLLAACRAAQAGDRTMPEEARWAVIREMEQAWSELPVHQRVINRKHSLQYLFGFSSSTLLSDFHIAALHDWLVGDVLGPDFDALSDLRLCLAAALSAEVQAADPPLLAGLAEGAGRLD